MIPAMNWSYPTALRFGAGRVAELAEACRDLGLSRPLVVTDRVLSALPPVAAVRAALEGAGIPHALFDAVDPNPTDENLDDGTRVYRDGGHDGVICVGGGSALDLGKLIAVMARQSVPVWDLDDSGPGWRNADPDRIAPSICLPTTAGTGSEVGRAAVLTDTGRSRKIIIFHPKMMPARVILDPELTVGMPRGVTVGTGMDALAHCLEAYCSPHFHPMSQGVALEGIRLVLENLPRAAATPDDLDARGRMLTAGMMGAVAFQKGLGAIHSLSHPIGARHHTHHGTTNAVVMPAVLRFNRAAVEDRIAAAAAYLGIPGGFNGFHDALVDLREALGVPDTLGDLGVPEADVPAMVPDALADPSCGGNPVAMDAENTRALFAACFVPNQRLSA